MTEEKKNNHRLEVLSSVMNGLIGNISDNVRMITIDWSEKHFYIRAFFNRPTTEDDLEDFQSASTEVAADFPNMNDFKEEVIYSLEPIFELPPLKEMIFLRKGEIEIDEESY